MPRDELAAFEQRIAQNEPSGAELLRELRTLVAEVAKNQHPQSLAELRSSIPRERRGLLQFVLMDMLDQRELEISEDQRLIVRLG